MAITADDTRVGNGKVTDEESTVVCPCCAGIMTEDPDTPNGMGVKGYYDCPVCGFSHESYLHTQGEDAEIIRRGVVYMDKLAAEAEKGRGS
ncbi:MAG: hypothetical protein CMI53_03190 [Parcubacteria group bacterium]|jgi:hypothetical protein|nr:hypothetical protein [Parcubacteria group bacterium]|tara:strand:- start:2566 stop:2838 length:273 start_codon:yes stop_codon:yes gene_type:complete